MGIDITSYRIRKGRFFHNGRSKQKVHKLRYKSRSTSQLESKGMNVSNSVINDSHLSDTFLCPTITVRVKFLHIQRSTL